MERNIKHSQSDKNNNRIVEVLVKHEPLVKDWKKFYCALGLTNRDIVQWDNGYNNGTLNTNTLFMKIIQTWKLELGSAATLQLLCKVLLSLKMVLVAECLEEEFPVLIKTSINQNSTISPQFNVGHVTKNFVGRHKELQKLHEIYNNRKYSIILISGLGGIGKTELTKKFAHEIYNNRNVTCTWINGETDQSIRQSLTALAENFGIPFEHGPDKAREIKQIFHDVRNYLKNNDTYQFWLVIFDSVDDMSSDILSCLQLLGEAYNSLAIITSRNRTVATEETILISLEEWDTSDAVDFVKKSLDINDNKEDALIRALCDKMGNHALGMQQAVAYIIYQQRNSSIGVLYSILNYLIEFEAGGRKTSQLLDHKLSEISHKFAKTTYVTWDISIAKVKATEGAIGNLAVEMLNTIAYFDSNGVQLQFITKTRNLNTKFAARVFQTIFFRNKISDAFLNKAAELLKAYSLIKIENGLISTHRLLQEVIRLKLRSEKSSLLASIVAQMAIWPRFSRHEVTHVLSVWKHASKNTNLLRKYPKLAMNIFNCLLYFALYSEMFNFATHTEKLLRDVLGINHCESLGMKHNLAVALNSKGDYDKSLIVFVEVWEKEKAMLGETHDRTLTTAHNMALVLFKLKRFVEAKKIWLDVFESRMKILGENHRSTMTTKNNIGALLCEKRDFMPAMGILKKVLEWRQTELGSEHPRTLMTKNNIGRCLFGQGEYREAKKIFKSVLHVRKAKFGDDYPLTLMSMHWLGITHNKLGDNGKSLGILEQVLSRRTRVLGCYHPDTIITQGCINDIKRERNCTCGFPNDTSQIYINFHIEI